MGAIDTIFLGIFTTTQVTGVYRVSLKLALPVSFILTAINSISTPKFAELFYQKRFTELKESARFASKLSFLFALPVIIALILCAKPVLSYLGHSFQIGFIPFLILLVGKLISAYCGPNKPFLNMTENHTILGKILVLATLLNIMLNYILIPIYGINGAAISTSTSIVFWNITTSFVIYKKYGYWINYLPKLFHN
jgi:O-antigen/teichoic acid export membrane protein